jgi:hypothetical protein
VCKWPSDEISPFLWADAVVGRNVKPKEGEDKGGDDKVNFWRGCSSDNGTFKLISTTKSF